MVRKFPLLNNNTSLTFTVDTYQKNSPDFLEVDAHFTAAEAGVKGFMKRVETYTKSDPQVNNSAPLSGL